MCCCCCVVLSLADCLFVVLLPGTGEHGFVHRRTSIAIPLAKQGLATLGRCVGSCKAVRRKLIDPLSAAAVWWWVGWVGWLVACLCALDLGRTFLRQAQTTSAKRVKAAEVWDVSRVSCCGLFVG